MEGPLNVAAGELVDAVLAASDRLVAAAERLHDEAIGQPSLLPNWTVGHVLSHVALNAEAFVRVAEDLRAGRLALMYPDGADGRNRAIESAAVRPAAVIAAHLRSSSSAFDEAWREPPPAGVAATAAGFPEFQAATVPLRRFREVEVHGADSGLSGFTPTAWSEPYVAADLPTQWATVAQRCEDALRVRDETGTMWEIGEGAALVEVDRRTLLAWLLDRASVSSLPDLVSWGDQSRWRPDARS